MQKTLQVLVKCGSSAYNLLEERIIKWCSIQRLREVICQENKGSQFWKSYRIHIHMSICCNIASLWEHQLVAWVRYSERNRQARGRGAIVLLKVFLHKFRSDDSWELLIDYQWQRNNEKKQVSGFCSTRKRNKGVGFAGHSLDLKAKSSSLCEKSQVIAKVQGSLIVRDQFVRA